MLFLGVIRHSSFAAPIHSILPGLALLTHVLGLLQLYRRRIIGTTCDGGSVIPLGLIRLPPRITLLYKRASAWELVLTVLTCRYRRRHAASPRKEALQEVRPLQHPQAPVDSPEAADGQERHVEDALVEAEGQPERPVDHEKARAEGCGDRGHQGLSLAPRGGLHDAVGQADGARAHQVGGGRHHEDASAKLVSWRRHLSRELSGPQDGLRRPLQRERGHQEMEREDESPVLVLRIGT